MLLVTRLGDQPEFLQDRRSWFGSVEQPLPQSSRPVLYGRILAVEYTSCDLFVPAVRCSSLWRAGLALMVCLIVWRWLADARASRVEGPASSAKPSSVSLHQILGHDVARDSGIPSSRVTDMAGGSSCSLTMKLMVGDMLCSAASYCSDSMEVPRYSTEETGRSASSDTFRRARSERLLPWASGTVPRCSNVLTAAQIPCNR
jgi:hypothetical protein